jgi:hypothetical protein
MKTRAAVAIEDKRRGGLLIVASGNGRRDAFCDRSR